MAYRNNCILAADSEKPKKWNKSTVHILS